MMPAAPWDHVSRHTDLLLHTSAGLDEATVRAPSRCAGWTRGHVLSHIARNADAMTRMIRGVIADEDITMYTSDAERDREIDEGATRPPAEQIEDIRVSAVELALQAQLLGQEYLTRTVPRTPGSAVQMPIGLIGTLRLNEVVLHHIDLDADFGFADIDDYTVGVLYDLAVGRTPEDADLTLETVEGDLHRAGRGSKSVRGSRRGVLAYLTRQQSDEVTIEQGAQA